jgi:predicted nucleic acid-binding protein
VRRIFVDTAHLLAVLWPGDNLHGLAARVASDLARDTKVGFVTTHLVLAELLAAMAGGGPHVRLRVAEYVEGLIAQKNVTIVDLTPTLFERGLDLYQRRSDKSYSLTDCVSMIVCRDLGITDVLTADHDFEQEGFNILLGRAR